jgi:hypothetical protein
VSARHWDRVAAPGPDRIGRHQAARRVPAVH